MYLNDKELQARLTEARYERALYIAELIACAIVRVVDFTHDVIVCAYDLRAKTREAMKHNVFIIE